MHVCVCACVCVCVYMRVCARVCRAGGVVYLAKDLRTGNFVALKLAPVSDLANLKNEIALQRLCAHECIVSCLDTYITSDHLWVGVFACLRSMLCVWFCLHRVMFMPAHACTCVYVRVCACGRLHF
jgi:hypothetical protein